MWIQKAFSLSYNQKMHLVGPEYKNISKLVKPHDEQNHPLRNALSNAKNLIFPPLVPESDLQDIDKRIAVTGWKETCSLITFYIGGPAFLTGVFDQTNAIPTELTLSLGIITTIALPSAIFLNEQRSKYYEIRDRLIQKQNPQQIDIAVTETSVSLAEQALITISLVKQYAGQLGREDIDLAQKSAARSWLQEVHNLTGKALDLLRPAQGNTRSYSDKPAEPFSGPKHQ